MAATTSCPKALRTCVQRLQAGQDVLPKDASGAVQEIMRNEATETEMASFLTGLSMRGMPSPPVLQACAEAMSAFAVPCTPKARMAGNDAVIVDIVGTGGDGKDAFNVSTAAGLVVAACGITVAKHGNRSSSGSVGSADFLEALGARVSLDGAQTAHVVDGCGFGFLFARMFHPAMKNVAAVRKQLGFRTVFNLLGPLTNPAKPTRSVIGVSQASLGPVFADMLVLAGVEHALVVYSTDGLDEISPAAPTMVWEVVKGDPVKHYTISPSDFGLPTHSLDTVCGGTAQDRATSFRAVLAGEAAVAGEPRLQALRDFILLQAAAGLYVAGKALTLAEAATLAAKRLDDGTAQQLCEQFVALTLDASQRSSPGKTATPRGDDSVAYSRSVYVTSGGVKVHRQREPVREAESEISAIAGALDSHLGCLLVSDYEHPGRYSRWTMGFQDPPVVIVAKAPAFTVTALNARGKVLLPAIHRVLDGCPAVRGLGSAVDGAQLTATVVPQTERVSEEERSHQPSIFSVLRAVIGLFFSSEDDVLGLYGAFGYDLCFQFEPTKLRMTRDESQREIVLYIPDSVFLADFAVNHHRSWRVNYDFEVEGAGSTVGLPRDGPVVPFAAKQVSASRDHPPGRFADKVRMAKEKFKVGDLFEAVLSQTFVEPCPAPPSELFRRTRVRNPAPFGFLMNLGSNEYLVGASPEMYVRVQARRVETCPISGTIKRGDDAIADAGQILELLSSKKEESELTMCTDVDRNDKSRVCVSGSVKVLARRQIEMYSRLIHTVDHVEGLLRPGFDALDAFMTHMWAVTVTGAPKAWAMQFLEDKEETPRRWYAGAVGLLNFNGDMNTGLTLRTIQILDGVASVRAGATLLWDSDPEAEEAETMLKASAFLDALRRADPAAESASASKEAPVGAGFNILVIDHEDSFVHTLANYLRQTGANVQTLRHGFDFDELDTMPDMVCMSPGPGCPKDFNTSGTFAQLIKRRIPCFGVCLGLQAMVEHFGGSLDVLGEPLHGKPSEVTVKGGYTFADMPSSFEAARYHSLYASAESLPAELKVTAVASDGVIMALEHRELPLAAVQFHPESILTGHTNGLHIVENVIRHFRSLPKE